MKKIFLLVLFVSVNIVAQKSINKYKYVIVPNQFEFVKSPDKYQTSSLTKFLFNKYGFKAFLLGEEYPQDMAKNRCLALTADIKDKSSMFTTKSVIELKDCNDKVVFTSLEGKSKSKDYKKAYHESIRNAFKAVKRLNYVYVPAQEEIIASQKPVTTAKKVVMPATKIVSAEKKDILYAQAKPNGYQLVNTKPEVVFELLNTNVKDVFIIKNKNGILYKNSDVWMAELYTNGNKLIKVFEIKF